MAEGYSKIEQLLASRFDVYRFDDFEPGGQPRFQSLQSDLTLDQIVTQFQTQPRVEIEAKLVMDAWRGGAFLTPELLVIIAGDMPRV
ncbi:MAG: hypothetical protein ABI882_11810 [Acidobacteriota bacterium]